MQRICSISGEHFEITQDDLRFYDKLGVPPPRLSPAERQRRRLAWRNERTLYRRTCSGSGRTIYAMYPHDSSFPVYDHDFFFSDRWSALSYGIDFNPSHPFFALYYLLQQRVPRVVNYSMENENAEYGNLASWNKNCFMLFEADNNRDCLYSEYTYRSVDVVDSSYATECELCYECLDISGCYNLCYCYNCKHCHDSWFLQNCIGCRDCFGCTNLRNKQYYFCNAPLSKEEYLYKLSQLPLASRQGIGALKKKFLELCSYSPQKHLHGEQNESCTGDYLNNSRNAHFCYDCSELKDCKYVCNSERLRDAYDIDTYGGIEGSELVYECHSVGRGSYNTAFGNNVYQNVIDSRYCDGCANVRDCFGCISLHHAQYCILNKQYSREDYFALRDRIVAHMESNGEWGEFFPIQYSPFAYNETMAQVHYPLSRSQALQAGYRWKEFDEREYVSPECRVPDHFNEITPDICDTVFACVITGKNYKIQKPELKFYHKLKLPLPERCPDQRFKDRLAMRNPRQLWRRQCSICSQSILSSYSPERQEKILCAEHYSEIVT